MAPERTTGEFRKLTIKARCKVCTNLMDPPLRETVVIDEPLLSWREGTNVIDRFFDRAIGAEQNSSILSETLR
jgi:hypothetical protein